MRSLRTYKTEGIVLKRSNYGEADRILTIFTRHYGKKKALAKGVRKIKSRKGGNVESFNHVTLFFVRRKSLDLITEAQSVDSFAVWRHDLGKVSLAFYFCELVDKLTAEDQENEKVFRLLLAALKGIERNSGLSLVRGFEEELLNELGFGVPDSVRTQEGSLINYIETVTEREIKTPKVIKRLV